MSYLFFNCTSLTTIIGLSNFDTSKVTKMDYIFYSCSSLKSLNLSNFNTSLITNMGLNVCLMLFINFFRYIKF